MYTQRQFQQPFMAPPGYMARPASQPPAGNLLPVTVSAPMAPIQPAQPLSQSASPVMSHHNAMKGGQSPMNGDNSPMTDGSSVMAATTPNSTGAGSPALSPTNGGAKKPKLRVQIPTEGKESNNTLAGPLVKEEESSELPPVSIVLQRGMLVCAVSLFSAPLILLLDRDLDSKATTGISTYFVNTSFTVCKEPAFTIDFLP